MSNDFGKAVTQDTDQGGDQKNVSHAYKNKLVIESVSKLSLRQELLYHQGRPKFWIDLEH